MKRNSTMRRLAALLLCAALFGTMTMQAGAMEAYETTWVANSGSDVIDSLYGVDAHFSSGNCWDYVRRFYKTLYGLDLIAVSCAAPRISAGGEGMTVEQVSHDDVPQTGDILYGTASMRASRDHYAIVKYYDAAAQQIVMIEENFKYGGKAACERRIAWPSSVYHCYRILKGGVPLVPNLIEDELEEPEGTHTRISEWAEDEVLEASALGIYTLEANFTADATREQFCEMAVHTAELLIGEPERLRPLEDGMEGGYVGVAYQIGLIDGNGTSLDPDGKLTREQAAKILCTLFSMVGEIPESDEAILASFCDADEISAWATRSAATMAACGVFQGSGSDGARYFAPKATLSLEMGAALMVRLYHDPAPEIEMMAYEPIESFAETSAAMATAAHSAYLYRADVAAN